MTHTVDELVSAVWMLMATDSPTLLSFIRLSLRVPYDSEAERRLDQALAILQDAGVITLNKYGEYFFSWDDTESTFAQV